MWNRVVTSCCVTDVLRVALETIVFVTACNRCVTSCCVRDLLHVALEFVTHVLQVVV